MASSDGTRPLEQGVHTGAALDLSYGHYLHLDELLGAQHPLQPARAPRRAAVHRPAPDLRAVAQAGAARAASRVRQRLADDDLRPALKGLARVKHIQRTLTEQWSVLATLTPSEYARVPRLPRPVVGVPVLASTAPWSSCSATRTRRCSTIFDARRRGARPARRAARRPSLYDEFLRHLARRGHPVPEALLDRDVTRAHVFTPELVPGVPRGLRAADEHWEAYETCEELVDLEDNFQLWRFRHLKTVERMIGFKRGTGGSSGVPFLRAALELTFFPELYAVRTEIGP